MTLALVLAGLAAPFSALGAPRRLEEAVGDAGDIAAEARKLDTLGRERRSVILRVLSYNIKGTPVAPLEGFGHDRYERIASLLSERRERGRQPHVVLLQEAFVAETRRLSDGAGYPYQVRGPRRENSLLDGGLYILSEHPIIANGAVAFGRDACTGWDCQANKGAMFARLSVPGLPCAVDVFNTHMQAGRGGEAERMAQIDILDGFLRQDKGVAAPIILAGDFNTKPKRPSYAFLTQRIGLANAGTDCRDDTSSCSVSATTEPLDLVERTHDQHFYGTDGSGPCRIRPVHAERNFAPKGSLSDHLGYEVHYEIQW